MEPLVNEAEAERPVTSCERCGADVEGLVFGSIPVPLRFCASCSAAVVAEEDSRDHMRALDEALRRAGGVGLALERTLDTHPDAAAVAVGRGWLEGYRNGERQNLWLYGDVGTGKTGIAWGIVRELTEEAVDAHFAADEEFRGNVPRQSALFLVWRDLYDDLIASFHDVEAMNHEAVADPARLLSIAKRVPVLVLDDLGAGRPPTPYALEQLEILVDQRYRKNLTTIVTSNFGSKVLTDRLGHADPIAGARIVSRLVEGAVGHQFKEGQVRRRAARAA